ncbi:hypothetical protein AURDEDRAFT_117049 [Auricularia subglabra TFB-10046 SS5]|nr:hypothetical protein AURDEDRAFT_117049 [Auricularia subglabra TFB-10046 SS5]
MASETNPAVTDGPLGDTGSARSLADLLFSSDAGDTLTAHELPTSAESRWTPNPELTARIHRYQQRFDKSASDSLMVSSPSDLFYAEQGTSRPDRLIRPRVRDMIAEILLSDADPFDAVDSLEGCREQCAAAGVPFSELLDLDIDAFGAPPLVVEILRAEWSDPDEEMAPPLLTYIASHTNQRNVAQHIRRAAMARGENEVFQRLRHYIPEDTLDRGAAPLYDGEVTEQPGAAGFVMRLQVDGFSAMLRDAASKSPLDRYDKSSARAPVEIAGSIEFIAANRMWELRVGDNSLALKLMQGDAANIDARVVALLEDVHQLLLPRAALHPLSTSGQHAVVCKPCFVPTLSEHGPRGFADDACGQLVLELHVALAPVASASATPQEETKVPSDLDAEGWENLDTESATDTEAGWVKASWSGRDEEL